MKIKAVQGTQDILAKDSYKWQFVESRIRDFMKRYNYNEVRTPIFERTELFSRGIGEMTDIVSKEMYTFQDSGDRMLTLRPENTASICRTTIENNLMREIPQNKMYYIGPMFRRERPQKGRYRQFHQFGIEALGARSAELDAECIIFAYEFYKSFKLKNIQIKVNSVGNVASRDAYKDALRAFVLPQIDSYCDDCKTRIEGNPLRVLDCKKDAEKNTQAPKLYDSLDAESKQFFDRVIELLDANEIPYEIDANLVRGLDYYTDTVFEITSSDLGSQSALCGGGRYDLLLEELGGKPTPAVGFAGGIERLMLSLEANGFDFGERRLDFFIATMDDASKLYASKLVRNLRSEGFKVETEYLNRSIKAQMKYANKLHARYAVVIGEEEIKTGVAKIKFMDDGKEEEIHISDLNFDSLDE